MALDLDALAFQLGDKLLCDILTGNLQLDLWVIVAGIGLLGSGYAIFGGLKSVAVIRISVRGARTFPLSTNARRHVGQQDPPVFTHDSRHVVWNE